jgi:hypothetical protein
MQSVITENVQASSLAAADAIRDGTTRNTRQGGNHFKVRGPQDDRLNFNGFLFLSFLLFSFMP